MYSRAALRYAKAFYIDSSEGNNTEAIVNAIHEIQSVLKDSRDLQAALKSPIVTATQKENILLEVFKALPEQVIQFLRLVVRNQRAALLLEITNAFVQLHEDTQGIKTARVISATALEKESTEKIKNIAKTLSGGKTIAIENQIDASLLGGFVLQIDDLQYNASLSNQFNNLKREFSKTN